MKLSFTKQILRLYRKTNLNTKQIADKLELSESTVITVIQQYFVDLDNWAVYNNSFKPKENDVTEDELFNPKFLNFKYWQVKDEMPSQFKEVDIFETLKKLSQITDSKENLYKINKEYKLITDMVKFNEFVNKLNNK